MSSARLVGVLLSVAIGWLAVGPPEHVHEEEEHGQAHFLVHRHLEPHPPTVVWAGRAGVLDHGDAPILTLTAAFTIPGVPSVGALPVVTVVVDLEPAVTPVRYRTPPLLDRLIHGPPRAPVGLRAPPPTSRL